MCYEKPKRECIEVEAIGVSSKLHIVRYYWVCLMMKKILFLPSELMKLLMKLPRSQNKSWKL
ncbi:hypothetical protein JTB14_001766 [Gonioctena quinquepunctata]|nr:hypothetical protein JTB14_001766 [Gonioctena quinquepunctata]